MKILITSIFCILFCQLLLAQNLTNHLSKKLKIKKYSLSIIYFVEPSCPITVANMPYITRFESQLNKDEQVIYILPNQFVGKGESIKFMTDNNLKGKYYFDPKHKIVKALHASITPEVFFDRQNKKNTLLWRFK